MLTPYYVIEPMFTSHLNGGSTVHYESKYRVVKTNRFGRMMDQEPVTDLIVDAILGDRADVYIPSEWRIISVLRE